MLEFICETAFVDARVADEKQLIEMDAALEYFFEDKVFDIQVIEFVVIEFEVEQTGTEPLDEGAKELQVLVIQLRVDEADFIEHGQGSEDFFESAPVLVLESSLESDEGKLPRELFGLDLLLEENIIKCVGTNSFSMESSMGSRLVNVKICWFSFLGRMETLVSTIAYVTF